MGLLDELARQLASADASGSATGSGAGGSQDQAAQLVRSALQIFAASSGSGAGSGPSPGLSTSRSSAGALGSTTGALGTIDGLRGLAGLFEQNGLGDLISSWIGTGQNQAISPGQLSEVLGQQRVTEFSQQAGVAPQQAPSVLAQLLPVLIDQLTPDGRVPQQSNLLDIGMRMLRGSRGQRDA